MNLVTATPTRILTFSRNSNQNRMSLAVSSTITKFGDSSEMNKSSMRRGHRQM